MKKFNRVLAMLLALVTVLAILPVSAFADAWLKVETDKEKVENVTTTDVTVTVDPKALLSYLQDGDLKGLLTGVSLKGGLSDIITLDEFFAIVPKDRILNLVNAVLASIDVEELISYVGLEELFACADKDALVDLFTDLPDLQDYVKDFEALMGYVDKNDIEGAISLIKTEELINAYKDKLMDLALELDESVLFDIVDINAAVNLDGIDLVAAANMTYIEGIGYATLANNFVDKEKLDEYVDANYDRFSASLPAYVNTGVLSGMFSDVEDQIYNYMDVEKAEAILRVAYEEGAFADDVILNYYDGVSFDIEGMIAAGILEPWYDELLSGYNGLAAAFDVKVLLFGNADLDPLFPNIASLVTEGVLDVQTLLDDGILNVQELITAKVISIDALRAAGHKYEDMANISAIKIQIQSAIKNNLISSQDIIDCLQKVNGKTDYTAAVQAIGVDVAINKTCGYEGLINNYVTDLGALIATFDIDAITNEIMADGKIADIFDVMAMVEAIGVSTLVSTLDVQKAAKVVYESGAVQALISSLDFESFVIPVFSIFSAVMHNITAIEIDGVVVTEQENGYIKLIPGKLLDALENLVPTLTELSNIDDSGKLFTASFAISYRDGDAIKTKALNFNFVLTAGTDTIRKVASKISLLLDKVGTIGLTDGKLVADVKIPSEFASLLRVALEKMADSTDPEFNTLKDKVLAIYDQAPSDFIAFTEGLTIEEIVAVLDAINPALFGKVYNKALASRYAQVLLAYVEAKTGYDFSDNLEAQNLINTIANIPTFEVFVEKLENVTGIEITDRLPAKVNGYLDNTVYDVIDKLADVAGVDFDLQNLLKQAAASADPFAYLYTAVVNKVENSGAVYNAVKVRALKVVNRLMATRFGAVVADNCLMDFYRGNSAFVFEKSVTFDAKVVLEKGIDKLFNVLGDYTGRLEPAREYAHELLDIVVNDGAYVTTGFDVTVRVSNLYRVTFKNELGAPILTTLLPAGTDLNKMVDYASRFGAAFNGWMDEATGKYLTKMPAKDVVVKADVQGISYHTVTIIPRINGQIVDGAATIQVKDGDILSDYEYALNQAAKTLYPALTANEKFLGYAYTHAAWGSAELDITVEDDSVVLYADIKLNMNHSDVAIKIKGLGNGVHYSVILSDDSCTILLDKNWNEVLLDAELALDSLYFDLSTEFMASLGNRALIFAATGAQSVTISAAKVAQIAQLAKNYNADSFGFSYAFADSAVGTGLAENNSQAEAYEFLFAMQDNLVDLGNFEKGEVVIVLPFTGKKDTDERTFVYVTSTNGEGVAVTESLIAGETDRLAVNDSNITIDAPHFSNFTLVNKYHLILDTASYLEDGTELNLAGSIAVVKGLADSDLETVNGANGYWYEAGCIVNATIEEQTQSGYEYVGTKAIMVSGNVADLAAGDIALPMPAESVTIKHYAKASIYSVRYYVNGQLMADLTKTYTLLAPITEADVKNTEGYTEADGWYWYSAKDIATTLELGGDLDLFWVNNNVTKIEVQFYIGEDQVAFDAPLEYTIIELRDGAIAGLKYLIDSKAAGYNWYTITEGDLAKKTYLADYINNYGALIQFALLNGNVAKFYGEKDNRVYHVYTDGNAVVTPSDALAGTTITIDVTNKPGHNVKVDVYETIDGSTLGDKVVVTDNTFVMPTSNVIVKVTYEAVSITYTDKDGNVQTGKYGDIKEIVVVIPAGCTLNATDLTTLASAPAGLTLAQVERGENGSLILTYRYELLASVDENAFLAQVKLLIAAAEYTQTWIVDGVTYSSEAEAKDNIPAGMKFVKWIKISDNVNVAVLEAVKNTADVWLIVCIILAVLLLLAIIALIYVLHITDKIGASWITKVCTAIVSAFFAFCMLVANLTLKVLNFVGIKQEDILEELPAEPVEDIPAAYIDPETVGSEEAAEEVAEEATEEAAEEATEEVAEDAILEDVVAEDATEVVVIEEAIVEEATEEAAEEAVAEEATEEAVDAVMLEDVVVEAATEEAVEEAVAEEATEEAVDAVMLEDVVVEAATEEAAEEAVAEEATEEIADAVMLEDIVIEAATEEAIEEVIAQAAIEEAAEEAVAEEATEEVVAEEATEEAAEEVVAEEVTEETAEEVVEEEQKDE